MSKDQSTRLIEEWLPSFDFVEQHAIVIHRSPDDVFAAIRKFDFGDVASIRLLFALRSLPSIFRSGSRRLGLTISALERNGFVVLAEERQELLIGVVGKFWKPSGQVMRIEVSAFRSFEEPGFAKAFWNFRVDPAAEGTLLRTETRIQCLGPQARRSFGWYWRIVGPFSGLIRMAMLKAIKRKLEQSGR